MKKYKILDRKKYRGQGRPRNSDYSYLTTKELNERARMAFYKQVSDIFNKGFSGKCDKTLFSLEEPENQL